MISRRAMALYAPRGYGPASTTTSITRLLILLVSTTKYWGSQVRKQQDKVGGCGCVWGCPFMPPAATSLATTRAGMRRTGIGVAPRSSGDRSQLVVNLAGHHSIRAAPVQRSTGALANHPSTGRVGPARTRFQAKSSLANENKSMR